MAFHPARWFFTNRYLHIRSFLEPSLMDPAVPDAVRDRLRPRLHSAIRLGKARIAMYALVYSAVIAPTGALVADTLATIFANDLFRLASAVFGAVLLVAAALALIGLLGVTLLNRALAILEAEIYILGMEVVARCVAAGDAKLPSGQRLGR